MIRDPVVWFARLRHPGNAGDFTQRHPGNAKGIIRDRHERGRLLRSRIGRFAPFRDEGRESVQPDFI